MKIKAGLQDNDSLNRIFQCLPGEIHAETIPSQLSSLLAPFQED